VCDLFAFHQSLYTNRYLGTPDRHELCEGASSLLWGFQGDGPPPVSTIPPCSTPSDLWTSLFVFFLSSCPDLSNRSRARYHHPPLFCHPPSPRWSTVPWWRFFCAYPSFPLYKEFWFFLFSQLVYPFLFQTSFFLPPPQGRLPFSVLLGLDC